MKFIIKVLLWSVLACCTARSDLTYYPAFASNFYALGMMQEYYSGTVERCRAIGIAPPFIVRTYYVYDGYTNQAVTVTNNGTAWTLTNRYEVYEAQTLTNQVSEWTHEATYGGGIFTNWPVFTSSDVTAMDSKLWTDNQDYYKWAAYWLADTNGQFAVTNWGDVYLNYTPSRAEAFNHFGIGVVWTSSLGEVARFSEGPPMTQNIILAETEYGAGWLADGIDAQVDGEYTLREPSAVAGYKWWNGTNYITENRDTPLIYIDVYGSVDGQFYQSTNWDSAGQCWTNWYYAECYFCDPTNAVGGTLCFSTNWNHLNQFNTVTLPYSYYGPPPERPALIQFNGFVPTQTVTITGTAWTNRNNWADVIGSETVTMTTESVTLANWWKAVTNITTDASPTNFDYSLIVAYTNEMPLHPDQPYVLTAEGYNERMKLLDAMRWAVFTSAGGTKGYEFSEWTRTWTYKRADASVSITNALANWCDTALCSSNIFTNSINGIGLSLDVAHDVYLNSDDDPVYLVTTVIADSPDRWNVLAYNYATDITASVDYYYAHSGASTGLVSSLLITGDSYSTNFSYHQTGSGTLTAHGVDFFSSPDHTNAVSYPCGFNETNRLFVEIYDSPGAVETPYDFCGTLNTKLPRGIHYAGASEAVLVDSEAVVKWNFTYMNTNAP